MTSLKQRCIDYCGSANQACIPLDTNLAGSTKAHICLALRQRKAEAAARMNFGGQLEKEQKGQ